jgi:hypothetical protein
MAFGRRKTAAEPAAPAAAAAAAVVDWRGVREFQITTALRRGAKLRDKDHGRLAVRVPVPAGEGEATPLVPCAFFSPKVALSVAASRAYTDESATRVLLAMEKNRHAEGGEEHHLVRDAAGAEIGLIRRIPPAGPGPLGKHGWRMEQPGFPPLEAARHRPPRRHGRAFLTDALASAVGMEEGGAHVGQTRTLAWHAGDEHVMTSRADGPVVIEADWLDRRLAIAYAMLLDR